MSKSDLQLRIRRDGRWLVRSDLCLYCSFAYSALASFRMGMSGGSPR